MFLYKFLKVIYVLNSGPSLRGQKMMKMKMKYLEISILFADFPFFRLLKILPVGQGK